MEEKKTPSLSVVEPAREETPMLQPGMSPDEAAKVMGRQEAIKRQKADPGFEIPKELVKIPSMGRLYPPQHPLHMKEEIEIRMMTTTEEDILTSRSLIRSGKAVDTVLNNCIVDSRIKVDDLLIGDKNAIMISLRTSSYGNDYAISYACPSCSEESKFEFDLSKLEIRKLEIDPVEEGVNRFSFETPTKIGIDFKFLTSVETKAISDAQSDLTRSGVEGSRNISSNLLAQIISVNGDESRKTISNYVRKMLARDSRALRKFIDNNEPDIIMKQKFSCSSCGVEQEVDVPITVEFFWPD